ncbi:MAG: hypothetical protein LBB83_09475 [Treponema sp.]|jgi:hypothetical protein|nr:hypothetical protein [Treponema sp.]
MRRKKARIFCGNFVFFSLSALFFLLLSVDTAGAEDRWYVSNAAGMALEPTFSRLAMREKYALAVTEILPGDLPANLREFYDRIFREAREKARAETEAEEEKPADTPFSLRLEKRILYENRKASRLQWLFLDGENQIRLAAAFALDPADYPPPETEEPAGAENPEEQDAAVVAADDAQENAGTADGKTDDAAVAAAEGETDIPAGEDVEESEEEAEEEEGEKSTVDYSGYIELYNPEGYIVEEHLFSSDSSDRMVNYFYKNQMLISAVTKIYHPASETEESYIEDYCTDYYRYSRSSSLRGVERVYHTETESEPVMLRFPHVVLEAAKNTNFVNPGISFTTEFFKDILIDPGSRVLYTTDNRGRVLTETRRNEDGEVIGELQNTWSGDRLVSVRWKAGDDERVTEFEYNSDGDRIVERNINRGVVERVVTLEGDQEIELLYIDGKPMLRAVWENGRKILEERIRPSAASNAGAVQPQTTDGAGF